MLFSLRVKGGQGNTYTHILINIWGIRLSLSQGISSLGGLGMYWGGKFGMLLAAIKEQLLYKQACFPGAAERFLWEWLDMALGKEYSITIRHVFHKTKSNPQGSQ